MSLFVYIDETEVETIEPVFKKRTFSDEWRAKISEASRGKNNPNFGKNMSAETRAKIGAASKKRFSEDTMRKMKLASGRLQRFHTPYGVFETSKKAAEAEGLKCGSSIRSRCDDSRFPNYFREKLDN